MTNRCVIIGDLDESRHPEIAAQAALLLIVPMEGDHTHQLCVAEVVDGSTEGVTPLDADTTLTKEDFVLRNEVTFRDL